MTDESFSFVTVYIGDTDIYHAKRTQYGYEVTVKYKNCEASVSVCYNDVVAKLRSREWIFV